MEWHGIVPRGDGSWKFQRIEGRSIERPSRVPTLRPAELAYGSSTVTAGAGDGTHLVLESGDALHQVGDLQSGESFHES